VTSATGEAAPGFWRWSLEDLADIKLGLAASEVSRCLRRLNARGALLAAIRTCSTSARLVGSGNCSIVRFEVFPNLVFLLEPIDPEVVW
jgi:hypothetical protein